MAAKRPAPVIHLCQICQKTRADMVLETWVTGRPETKTEWYACVTCGIGVLARVTGASAAEKKPEKEKAR